MPHTMASSSYHYDSDADSIYDSDNSSPSSVGFSRTASDIDYSPSTNLVSRASSETLASSITSSFDDDDCEPYHYFHHPLSAPQEPDFDFDIPPLEPYCHEIINTTVRPSNPSDFARLFPSTNRLSIRHDEFTSDGNMNLRIETDATYRNRRISMQLFHLRLHNLARREFSLRRYCRDSGREVCSSKRHYITKQSSESKRSVADLFRRGGGSSKAGSADTKASLDSAYGSIDGSRTDSSRVTGDSDSDRSAHSVFSSSSGSSNNSNASSASSAASLTRPIATDIMKLEFSNYARVDITRRSSRSNAFRYEFEWWGHTYEWRRTTDDQNMPGVVSFHLYRTGVAGPLAHIVPETRSPNQIMADEAAHGWIPPCHMWISNEDVLRQQTDHADVIVATGLMALTDDCIRAHWPSHPKKSVVRSLGAKSVTSLRSTSGLDFAHRIHIAGTGMGAPAGAVLSGALHKKFLPRFLSRNKAYTDY